MWILIVEDGKWYAFNSRYLMFEMIEKRGFDSYTVKYAMKGDLEDEA